ncbi:MAG: VgrG-related protein [Dehalococcoidia bacterium]
MVSATDVSVVQITVAGSTLAADFMDELALVRVDESVHMPSQCTLHFNDLWFNLFNRRTLKIGSELSVAFRFEGKPVTVFDGEVVSVSSDHGRGTGDEMVVTALDRGHRLHRQAHARTFLKQTDSAVAQKIAQEHGLQATVDATSQQHEYVVQHGETDFDFLRGRAERIGYQFWVSGKKLYFKRRPEGTEGSNTTLTWGSNLIQMRARLSAVDHLDEVTVRGWGATNKESVQGKSTASSPPVTFTTASARTQVASDAKTFGASAHMTGQVPVDSVNDAESLARSMMTRAIGSDVVLRGEAMGNPNIGAGREVTISGAASSLDGTYLLTSVEHTFGADVPYRTRFTSAGADPIELPDLLRVEAQGGNAGGWGGFFAGVVTNVNDPETLGRVKVKIATLGDEVESGWARVVSPGAGKDRGFELLPEVQDEVLVGFEFGDMQRPFVIGGLWNSKDGLPDAAAIADGKVKQRVWKSRLGHKIEMVDDDGKPALNITHSGGTTKIELTKDNGVAVTSDKPVTVKGKDVTLEATGNLTFKGQKISLKGSGGVQIDGGPDVTVKGSQIKLN